MKRSSEKEEPGITSKEKEHGRTSEEEETVKRMKELSKEVPPYHEGMYDLGFNLENIDSRESLRKFISHLTFLIDQVDQMNEYAEIYCAYPTKLNKINVESHLIAFAQACASFRYLLSGSQYLLFKQTFALYGLSNDEMNQGIMYTLILSKISDECVVLIRSFYYVEQKDNPPYPPAPPPIEGFPFAPLEGYRTDLPSLEIYDMLQVFTHKAMPIAMLHGYLEGYELQIIEAFDRIRSRNTDNMFVFNVDPVILKDELIKTIPNERSDVMYIIHSFQMFIVYGNFIVAESDPRLVTGLHSEEVINRSELASTAYLYLYMHGEIDIQPGKYRKSSSIKKKYLIPLRARKEIDKATMVTPDGMRLFIQKQAEPLTTLKKPRAFKTYQPGTSSSMTGICNQSCKRGECVCRDNLREIQFVHPLSTELNEELRRGYVPSIAYLQEVYNSCMQRSMQRATLHDSEVGNFDPRNWIYTPGNNLIQDKLQTTPRAVSRNREFIARIPLSTNKYINKQYNVDENLGAYGIYDLLNGRLISATNEFTDYIDQLDESNTKTIMKIRKDALFSKEPYEAIPHAPRYLYECYLSDIIGYFHSLGYRNVYFFEISCESDIKYGKPSPIGYTEKEAILVSNRIGTSGLGISRRNRKTRKPSKRGRRRPYGTHRPHRNCRISRRRSFQSRK
jgi:hypothetical protein